MTHYHFNVHNGGGPVPDEEGRELSGPEVARMEALKGARSIIADEVMQGRLDLSGRIEVTDADGRLLFIVRYSEAVSGPDEL